MTCPYRDVDYLPGRREFLECPCEVCGRAKSDARICAACREAARPTIGAPAGWICLVVDGAFLPGTRQAGAGLVACAGGPRGDVVTHVGCKFESPKSNLSEFQAIVRGLRWLPDVVEIYSDNSFAIGEARRQWPGRWFELLPTPASTRALGHGVAHDLATRARGLAPEGYVWPRGLRRRA